MQRLRDAFAIAWESPGGIAMSLSPVTETGGTLKIEVIEGAVHFQGTQCLYLVEVADRGASNRVLAEVEMTLPLSRCQITWKTIDATAEEGS
jgi:hypothetical protein